MRICKKRIGEMRIGERRGHPRHHSMNVGGTLGPQITTKTLMSL